MIEYGQGTGVMSPHTHLFSEVGNPSSRVITDSTTELTTDNLIVCNCAVAKTITMLAATGSQRIRQIASINAGVITVEGNLADTIDGDLNQAVNEGDCLWIIDYATGKWKIM